MRCPFHPSTRLSWAALCFRLSLLLPLICFAVGCGDSGPKTVQVKGKVLYQGEPVPKGRVTFEPIELEDKSAPSRPAVAFIQPDGTFEVNTFSAGDGMQPGEYRVVIWALEKEPGDDDWPNLGKTFFLEWLIPEQYGDSKTTPLTATIPGDQKLVELVFDLQDDAGAAPLGKSGKKS